MQGHQLHLVSLVLSLVALHHVTQGEASDHLSQRHRLFQLIPFQHLGDPAIEGGDVLHPHLGRLRAGGGLIEPLLVVDLLDHVPHRLHRVAAQRLITEPHQPVGKGLQGHQSATRQVLLQPQLEAGGKQALAALVGVLPQLLEGGGADFPARQIDHPQEGGVFVRIHQQLEVGHDVLDLGAGEKRGAARDTVGNAVGHQRLLEDARLMVAPIEDGVILKPGAVHELVAHQLGGDTLRLVLLILGKQHLDRHPVVELGEERLVIDVGVVGDQNVGALEDAFLGAVVLLQLDELEAGKILVQQHQILRLGTAPGVDGLVIVPHHGKTGPLADNLLHQLVLAGVGVLILIDQQVADLVLPAGPHLLVVLQQQGRHHDEVIKIQRVVGHHLAVIALVELGHQHLFRPPGDAHGARWQYEVVLPVGDLGDEGRELVLVVVELRLGQLFQQRQLVGVVEQGEVRLQIQALVLTAYDVETQGVEGGDHEPPRLLATQGLADPLLHLPRSLVGKGHSGDVAGVIAALLHQIGDLVGDDAGLARSGTRQHQARAGDKLDRFVLIGVELHGPDLLAYDEGRHCNRDPAGSRNRTQDPATSPCVCPSFSGSWPTFPEEMRGA
ncbi:hypothetical protein D3C79_521110 [compost metagenome]